MTDAASLWRTTIHVALPASEEPALLMLSGEAGWSLPQLQLPGRIWLSEVGELGELIAGELGIASTVLRCAWSQEDEMQHRREAVLVLDPAGAAPEPAPGSLWMSLEPLSELPLALPQQRPLLQSILAELGGHQPPHLRPPWSRPGWRVEASAWVETELERLGYEATGPVEQIRSWGISAILRVRTGQGKLYFKVANTWPLSAHEPLVMRTLSAWYPNSVPAPLAIDLERRWMLLRDFGPELRGNRDVATWEAAVQAYALLQRDAVERLGDLWAIGCADRRLDMLAERIDFVLADEVTLALLEPREADRCVALGPHLKVLAARLAEYHLPATLVHGDLHPGNIAAQEGTYLFYDWTDTAVAHTFIDLVTVLDEASTLPDSAQAARRLRDAYLSLWTDYEPGERLLEAWSLAEPLGVLHQVISYRNICGISETGTGFEYAGGLKFWVRKLLRMVDDNRS